GPHPLAGPPEVRSRYRVQRIEALNARSCALLRPAGASRLRCFRACSRARALRGPPPARTPADHARRRAGRRWSRATGQRSGSSQRNLEASAGTEHAWSRTQRADCREAPPNHPQGCESMSLRSRAPRTFPLLGRRWSPRRSSVVAPSVPCCHSTTSCTRDQELPDLFLVMNSRNQGRAQVTYLRPEGENLERANSTIDPPA